VHDVPKFLFGGWEGDDKDGTERERGNEREVGGGCLRENVQRSEVSLGA
jgi:hypothetical protein